MNSAMRVAFFDRIPAGWQVMIADLAGMAIAERICDLPNKDARRAALETLLAKAKELREQEEVLRAMD